MAVILDYVMNHGSSTHPIFVDATVGSTNPKRDWFVWSSTHPTGWNTFSGDPWRNIGGSWYYGIFGALVPDWNLRNPQVVAWHLNNLRFWLNRGADGFRFDAVSVLIENGPAVWRDAPETHAVLAQAKAVVDAYSKRYMVCEAPDTPTAYAVPTSCGRAFAFQAIVPLFASAQDGRLDAGLQSFLANPAADDMPLIVGNHDSFAGERVWSRLAGDQATYRVLAASYLLSSRTPFSYYGEDVGMAGGAGMTGDLALRVPMSWTSNPANAGFTAVAPWRGLSTNSTTQNVELEDVDANSLLRYYRSLLNLRKQFPALGAGTLSLLSAANDPVLRLTRESATECVGVAVNYSATAQSAAIDSTCASAKFTAVFGNTGAVAANASGDFTINVPAKSAAVYRAPR
jgi:maltose alpha-D-glucosyltransferase/alpha-amylase